MNNNIGNEVSVLKLCKDIHPLLKLERCSCTYRTKWRDEIELEKSFSLEFQLNGKKLDLSIIGITRHMLEGIYQRLKTKLLHDCN